MIVLRPGHSASAVARTDDGVDEAKLVDLEGLPALSRFALGFRNYVPQTCHAFEFEETGDAGARHVGIDVMLRHEQQIIPRQMERLGAALGQWLPAPRSASYAAYAHGGNDPVHRRARSFLRSVRRDVEDLDGFPGRQA